MSSHWHFQQTMPFISQGKDTTRPNFSREERSEVGILIREGLQNALDARSDSNQGAVRVLFREVWPSGAALTVLEAIFTEEFRGRLKSANDYELPPLAESPLLIIEDFGTKGLRGSTDNQNLDGQGQNWNAFWHREGEGAKDKASNGGAGQGKVTYYAHSYASTVLAVTLREEDGRVLMMGRAALSRDYFHTDGEKYYRLAYLTTSKAKPLPEENLEAIAQFSQAVEFSRQAEPGLSLAIPFSRPFTTEEAFASVVLDFYMPIADGRLEVQINGLTIGKDSIDALCDERVSDEVVRARNSSFTKGYRAFARSLLHDSTVDATLKPDWNKERRIPEAALASGSLDALRAKLAEGRTIGIELPLTIKKKKGGTFSTSFKVFLQTPTDLEHNEEAFVRQDLLIGGEGKGAGGGLVQKTRSLTWIKEQDLSDFLLAAEEPTHLKWNASLARDKAEYVSPEQHLRAIRQAVPRLVALLLGASGEKDFKALARYFAKPKVDGRSTSGGGQKKAARGQNDESFQPPPRQRKPFQIASAGTGIKVLPSGSERLTEEELPLEVLLELAYEGLDQDPFSAYDPFDFDLSLSSAYQMSVRGLTVSDRKFNRVAMSIREPDFELRVSGFDPNVRLRARLTYELPPEVGAIEKDAAAEETVDG